MIESNRLLNALGNWITYWLTILPLTLIKDIHMTDRLAWIAFVIMFGVVIAVADMNWPAHMGEQGALMDTIWGLLTSDYIPN